MIKPNRTIYSPRVKVIAFDEYQVNNNFNCTTRSKTEANIIMKKPLLNLKAILKDNKSYSNHDIGLSQIKEPSSSRFANEIYGKYTERIAKTKQPTRLDELEKIKIRFIALAESWRMKERHYLKTQKEMKQEISRLNTIIAQLQK